MTTLRSLVTRTSLARAAMAGCMLVPFASHGAPFELIYTGTFNSTEALNLSSASTPTFFTGTTPFTIRSFFDTASPNLAPPLPGPFAGFRAYAPSLTTLEVAGTTYTVDSILANATAGVTVAIFDQHSFTPDHYAIGLIADPAADGAGIVGDFLSASPDFLASSITPTTFTGYFGVGHGSGVCLQGTGADCQVNAITPWVLHDSSNASFSLTLGNFDEDYPVAHSDGVAVGVLNTAQLVAVPEPATYGMLLAGLAGVLAMGRKRAHSTASQPL